MNKTKRKTAMTRAVTLVLLALLPMTGVAQRVLTLDSCRQLAITNNKQLSAARTKKEIASYDSCHAPDHRQHRL